MPSKGDINPATGKPYAVNPATGVWDDNYFANVVEPQLRAGGGGGVSGGGISGGGSTDLVGLARQIAGFQRENMQPAISGLQERYKSLLNEIGQTATQELGRRGIPISSTSAQDFIAARKRPVLSQEAGDIGALQSGATQGALQGALDLLGLQEQRRQFDENLSFQQSNATSSSGSGSLAGLFGNNFQPSQSTPPTTSPAGGGQITPSPGFVATTINQDASGANNLFGSQGPFSSANVGFVGNQIGKTVSGGIKSAGNFLGNILDRTQKGAASFYGFR